MWYNKGNAVNDPETKNVTHACNARREQNMHRIFAQDMCIGKVVHARKNFKCEVARDIAVRIPPLFQTREGAFLLDRGQWRGGGGKDCSEAFSSQSQSSGTVVALLAVLEACTGGPAYLACQGWWREV